MVVRCSCCCLLRQVGGERFCCRGCRSLHTTHLTRWRSAHPLILELCFRRPVPRAVQWLRSQRHRSQSSAARALLAHSHHCAHTHAALAAHAASLRRLLTLLRILSPCCLHSAHLQAHCEAERHHCSASNAYASSTLADMVLMHALPKQQHIAISHLLPPLAHSTAEQAATASSDSSPSVRLCTC